jgi:hypothetical protein
MRVNSTLTSVTFTWESGIYDGGSPVRDFQVYWDEGDDTLPEDLFTLADDSTYLSQVHTQDSLTTSNYYRFWVVARNDAGISDRSVTLTVLAAIETSEPLGLSTTYQDEYRVALEWS